MPLFRYQFAFAPLTAPLPTTVQVAVGAREYPCCAASKGGRPNLCGPALHVNARQFGNSPLYVRHDERADRTVITAVSKAHMAMEVLTRLNLLTLEQVAGWDIEPAGNRVHQLIAGDREAINIPAAGKRIPRMRQRRDGGEQRGNNE